VGGLGGTVELMARTQPEGGGGGMRAQVGDRIVIRSAHVDEPVRDGEVLEVRGADGAPPYRVRWSDTGHEALFFPGPDATVHHLDTAPDD
jgi:hypothetical protein